MKLLLSAILLPAALGFIPITPSLVTSTATSSVASPSGTTLQSTSMDIRNSNSLSKWTPSSWDQPCFIPAQMPVYDDANELKRVTNKLSGFAPLVFAGEVRDLHSQLAKASQGQGFLLMGGDCAESFDEFSVNHVRDTFRVLLQMSLIMTFGGAMPVIKVGRMVRFITFITRDFRHTTLLQLSSSNSSPSPSNHTHRPANSRNPVPTRPRPRTV